MSNPSQTPAARQRRSFEFSPQYRPSLLCCLAIQFVFFVLTALVLDLEHRTNKLCCIAIVAQWMGVILIMGRRPLSPTWTDLLFIRFGIVPLTFATPWIAHWVWNFIGQSTQSGLERWFPRPPG